MRGSYDESFRPLYALAYRVGYRVLGTRAEAEDVAQEALARAYASWWRVSGYGEAWVVRVATNLSIDAARRRARTVAGEPADGAAPDPYTDERLDLQRALRQLPRRQRQVVALRYLADLPEDAVAAALGCSVGSVKTHGSRGLAALRAAAPLGGE